MRRVLLFWLCLLALSVAGQEAVRDAEKPGFFPVYSLIYACLSGEARWNPAWPPEFPPDAFQTGGQRPAMIEVEAGEQRLRCAWTPDGALSAFPFLLEGRLVQVEARRDASGRLTSIRVEGAGIAISPYTEDFPLMAKISAAGTECFVYFSQQNNSLTETWYDAEGSVLGVVFAGFSGQGQVMEERVSGGERRQTRYYYDSWGNVSGIDEDGRQTGAVYAGPGRPRYLDIRENGQKYAFQWDEAGLLRGLSTEGLEIRYEYVLDGKGAWTSRREIRMERLQPGLLEGDFVIPQGGPLIRRTVKW